VDGFECFGGSAGGGGRAFVVVVEERTSDEGRGTEEEGAAWERETDRRIGRGGAGEGVIVVAPGDTGTIVEVETLL